MKLERNIKIIKHLMMISRQNNFEFWLFEQVIGEL